MYAVLFKDHIHTDVDGKLAIFRHKQKAEEWVKNHGIMGTCKVVTWRDALLTELQLQGQELDKR